MFLDGLVGENDYDTAVKSSSEVNDQLKNFGFLIAHDKCHWSPCQKLDWLGYGLGYRKWYYLISYYSFKKPRQT
jgi:hypothetical protein